MARLKKILVVDDEAGIRNLLFDVLSDQGFNVALAKNGQESLEQMENCRFDLIITDISMPRVNGIELLRRMKEAGRKERIIIMTGKPLSERVLDGDIPPVITQLRKPFHITNFLDVVSSALAPQQKRKQRAPVRLGGRG